MKHFHLNWFRISKQTFLRFPNFKTTNETSRVFFSLFNLEQTSFVLSWFRQPFLDLLVHIYVTFISTLNNFFWLFFSIYSETLSIFILVQLFFLVIFFAYKLYIYFSKSQSGCFALWRIWKKERRRRRRRVLQRKIFTKLMLLFNHQSSRSRLDHRIPIDSVEWCSHGPRRSWIRSRGLNGDDRTGLQWNCSSVLPSNWRQD